LPELRKRSAERLATDKEYAYVREDIERFNKQQADKTSLSTSRSGSREGRRGCA